MLRRFQATKLAPQRKISSKPCNAVDICHRRCDQHVHHSGFNDVDFLTFIRLKITNNQGSETTFFFGAGASDGFARTYSWLMLQKYDSKHHSKTGYQKTNQSSRGAKSAWVHECCQPLALWPPSAYFNCWDLWMVLSGSSILICIYIYKYVKKKSMNFYRCLCNNVCIDKQATSSFTTFVIRDS